MVAALTIELHSHILFSLWKPRMIMLWPQYNHSLGSLEWTF